MFFDVGDASQMHLFEPSRTLVQGDSAVKFRVIGAPGEQASHANSMDPRTGGDGVGVTPPD